MYYVNIDIGNEKNEVSEYVTVKDFKEYLETLDDNDILVMSSDPEGNHISPVSLDTFVCKFDPDSARVGLRELTSTLIDDGYNENDLCEGLYAVAIYPEY